MPGLLKIGKTRRDSSARELKSTGIPTPFEMFSNNHNMVEDKWHSELEDYRVSSKENFLDTYWIKLYY